MSDDSAEFQLREDEASPGLEGSAGSPVGGWQGPLHKVVNQTLQVFG